MDPFDLEPFRERVQQLYVRERRSLKEVMKILQQEGCNASNMYLKKISAWDLRKYNKHEEMVPLYQTIQGATQQTPSQNSRTFNVRGREVSEAEVSRYFRRRKTSHNPRASIQVSPPNLPSTDFSSEEIDYDFEELRTIAFYRIRHPLGQPLPPLRLPETLENAQTWFKAISTLQTRTTTCYLNKVSLFGSNLPGETFETSVFEVSTKMHRYNSGILAGVRMIALNDSRQLKNGFASITRALEDLPWIVEHGHIEMVMSCFSQLTFISYQKQLEIGNLILRFMYKISRAKYGPSHELTLFARGLCQYWSSPNFVVATKVAYDATAAICGMDHSVSYAYHYSYVMGVRLTNPPIDIIGPEFEKLILHSERFEGKAFNTDVKREYAEYLAFNGQFAKGISILRDVGSNALQNIWYEDQANRGSIGALVDIALLLMDQPKLESFQEDDTAHWDRYKQAEVYFKQALSMATNMFGKDASFTISIANELGAFYNKHGKVDEAQEQYDHITELLKDFNLNPDSGVETSNEPSSPESLP